MGEKPIDGVIQILESKVKGQAISKIDLIEEQTEQLFQAYRERLPERFRDELKGFVDLMYVPLRLIKFMKHATIPELLESRFGFDLFDALKYLKERQAYIQDRIDNDEARRKEVEEFKANFDPSEYGSEETANLFYIVHTTDNRPSLEEECFWKFQKSLAKTFFSIAERREKEGEEKAKFYKNAGDAINFVISKGIPNIEAAIIFLESEIRKGYGNPEGIGGISLEATVKNSQRTMIIGEPGSGKTTSCCRLTQLNPRELGVDDIFFVSAASFRKYHGLFDSVSTRVRERYGEKFTEENIRRAFIQGCLADVVADSMRATLGRTEEANLVSTAIVHERIMRGNSLVIIDGLNELGGLSNKLVDQIELVLSDLGFTHEGGYGKNKYVLTTRRYNDPKTRLTTCNRYEILPLSDETIDKIISENQGCEGLKQEIKKIGPELRSNPLFLDMAIEIYKKTQKIAYNWGYLFESFLRTFLSSEESKFLEKGTGIIMGEAQPILEYLAYQMTVNNQVQIEWDEAYALIKARLGFNTEQLEGLVAYLLNGRIMRREGLYMRFMGQPLQECLTASAVKGGLDRGDRTLTNFYHSIKSNGQVNSQWYGSIFFLNNQLNSNQLVELVKIIECDAKLREFGDVKIYWPEKFSGKVVFKVAHYYANAEAQKEAAVIFDHLNKSYGLKVVCLEGAEGEVNTEWFRKFPDANIRRDVSTYFVKKGELTAPEYLSITTDYPILMYGVENRVLYVALLKKETEGSKDTALPDGTPIFFEERKKFLVNNTLHLMEKNDLRIVSLYYGGGGLVGQIWPNMFTDKGAIYIEIDTNSRGVNWDLYKKVLCNQRTSILDVITESAGRSSPKT